VSNYAPSPAGPYYYGVQRWEADGRPVAEFGTEGNVAFPLPQGENRFDQLSEAIQRKDGTVVIAVKLFDRTSSNLHGLAFARVHGGLNEGATWATHNEYGTLHREVSADGHGRFVSLVSTGSPNFDVAVRWYDEAGSRIYGSSSSTMPPRLLAIGSANEVFFDDSGTPYTVGQVEGEGGLAVVRFNRHGTVDTTFGARGLVRLDGRLNSVLDFTREPNGCLLARTWPEPGLVRMWP
jgi:hypothetical protein